MSAPHRPIPQKTEPAYPSSFDAPGVTAPAGTERAAPAFAAAGPVPAVIDERPTEYSHSAQMLDLPPVDESAFAQTRVRDVPVLDGARPERQAPPSPVDFAQQRAEPRALATLPPELQRTEPGQGPLPPRPRVLVRPNVAEGSQASGKRLSTSATDAALEAPPAQPKHARSTRGPAPEEAAASAPTAQHAQDDVVTAEPAALWRRLGAWLTDLLFVGVLALGLLVLALEVIAPRNLPAEKQLALVALPALGLAAILAFVYTALFAFLWDGRTPGRRLMGIHLVTPTGHAPGPIRALVRAGLSLVSFCLFLSGFWLALFDRHGQTLHDKLTRTFVVKLQDA